MKTFKLGDRYYYQSEYTGKFICGEIIKITPKFCILKNDSGGIKRKSKHLIFKTEDEIKLKFIKRIDEIIRDQFFMNIVECSELFKEMIEKYPEKFI